MFVTLKKDYLGHRAGAMLDILEEPVVKSLVEQGIDEATQGDPYGPLMAKAMEATIASLTKNIETVFNEAIRQFGQAQSRSRRNAIPAIFGEGNDGDPKKTFGHFLLAVRSRDVKTLKSSIEVPQKKKLFFRIPDTHRFSGIHNQQVTFFWSLSPC